MKTKILTIIMTIIAAVCMVGVPEGRCPKCGLKYSGWALRNPRHQACPKCGRGLDIRNSNGTISKGYSPLDAKGLQNKRPDIVKCPDRTSDDSYEEKRT